MNCPHVPELNYGEFSRRLHKKVVGRRIPLTGGIEVTARCNLQCAHCFINLPAEDRQARMQELTGREWRSLIDRIVDAGCLWLLLTGGEPFLRPDFLDIYTYAKNKGLLVTLFSNGTLLTPRVADYLVELPPFSIEITLYGRTQKTYEEVTGVPGSHARCMRGIELLMERKLPLKLKTMVLTLNRHELADMQAFAEGLGLSFHYDPMLNARADGGRSPAAFRLTPEDVVALDLADAKRLKAWEEFCEKFLGPPSDPDLLYHCGAGLNTFHIDSYGRMSACLMARRPSYDLRQGTFHEGLHGFLPQVRAQKRTRETPCRRCDLISLCGQCPGWAQMDCGDPEEPVSYLCRIAHLRAEAFGLNERNKQDGVKAAIAEHLAEKTGVGSNKK